MSDDDLRECPFCGKNMQKRDWEPDSEFIVWCKNCGAIGPNELTIELACDMWNLRRPEAELRARIAELEAQTRWIPVSERMPEINHPVLTIYSTFGGLGTHVIRCVFETGMWYDCGSGELCHPKNITHWMPLPQQIPENV